MAEERVYEMLWDCTYCGVRKLLAKTQRYCPQCGAPQDPKARYFPAEADKVEATGQRYEGADQICAGCQSPNGALAEFCSRCGSPLRDAAEVRRIPDQVRSDDEKFAASLSLRRQEAEQRRLTPVAEPARKRTGRDFWMFLVLLVLCLGIASLFWTRDETVQVTGHYWRQEIRIERYGPVSDSAWCDQVPSGAYGLSSHPEVRSHRQVPDGESCQTRRIDRGDGTFVEHEECRPRYRSEPVYDQRCDFRIDRWTPAGSAVAEGNDPNPRWPVTGITDARACPGCRREAARVADYQLLLRDAGGRNYRCSLPRDAWRGAGVGSRWNLEVGAVDKQPRCRTLSPAN